MLDLMSFDKLLGCSSRRSAAKKGRVEIHLRDWSGARILPLIHRYIGIFFFGDPSDAGKDAGKEARVMEGWGLCQSGLNFEIR
jgi:hypothetical protein